MVEVRRTARRTALRAAVSSSAAPLLAACIGSPRPATPAATSPAPGRSTPAATPRSASPAASSPASGTGSVSWSETATSIAFANQHIRLRLSKTTGVIDSLQLDGQELLGNGGSGYVDLDGSRLGHFTLGRDDRETTAYRVRAGDDFVDVTIAHEATAKLPFTIRHHYVLRGGERGLHLYTEFAHSAGDPSGAGARPGDGQPVMPAAAFDQTRFVLRTDPKLFTHASIEDDPIGTPWGRTATVMPRPADLKAGKQVQDATYDLEGLGSPYPKRYYTKYDFTVYAKDHQVHGLYGSGFGAWICQGNRESLAGGPCKQDLTVHQTDTTPVLLNMLHSVHAGSKPVTAGGDWSKTYGPFFLYLNRGDDPAALRADAASNATPAFDQPFYDALAIPGYVPSNQRSTVTGQIALPSGESMAGATVVLSQNRLEFQRMANGYQHWADTTPDGTFTLAGVRPGTYRLSAYKPGVFGEFQLDDVAVGAGTIVTLPKRTWTPKRSGTALWQIGTPDRTAAEFRHGDAFRNYGFHLQFAEEFPAGVDYVVGRSTERRDWSYVQYKRIGNAEQPDWNVRFDLDRPPPAAATATLTVALAAAQRATLTVVVNGTTQPAWSIPNEDSSSVAYRSGVSGLYLLHEFAFPAALLRPGTNTITFRLGSGSDNVLYDAIRLELDSA